MDENQTFECVSETAMDTPAPAEELSETERLTREIEFLRGELEKKRTAEDRIATEMEEFSRLFPERTAKDVPTDVWQEVERGIPLSAAYALYEKRAAVNALLADEVNRRNAALSAGKIAQDAHREFYTPDEVRAMSAEEVREHYKTIRQSMKKWR